LRKTDVCIVTLDIEDGDVLDLASSVSIPRW
jgi:hypothetical protein